MPAILQLALDFSGWIWGLPMILLIVTAAVYFTVRLRFMQFAHLVYIVKQLFRKSTLAGTGAGVGTITAFQSFAASLGGVIGAGNIVGVSVAVLYGGPGAIFWMVIIALIGAVNNFAEITLGQKYREVNAAGEYVGGPMYYIAKGLNVKWLGTIWACLFIIDMIIAMMVQANSIAGSMLESFSVSPVISGLFIMGLVGIVTIGGIKRIGKVAARLVPVMASLYVGAALLIVVLNIGALPGVIKMIISSAFHPAAATGGFGGATIVTALRWGVARGVYSNESGMGTTPIMHAPAKVDHPCRQGFLGIVSVYIDTIIVCVATALVIMTSGLWTTTAAFENPAGLTAMAFSQHLGPVGGWIVTLSLTLFAFTTLFNVPYMCEKCAEFFGGLKIGVAVRYILVAVTIIGAMGKAEVVWQFLDLALASIVLPNLIVLLVLGKKVLEEKTEFFNTPGKFYLKDIESGKK